MRQRDKYIPELEKLEIDLLVQAIHRLHRISLQDIAFPALQKQVWEAMRREKLRTVSALQEKVIHDSAAMDRFLKSIIPPAQSYPVGFYVKFRTELLPFFRTYPFIRIWQAGCGSVFDLYNLAIILLEEGVYEKSVIYSTDVNEPVLRRCEGGDFPLKDLADYQEIYHESGGKGELKAYFSGGGERGVFNATLRRNMVFAQHSLTTDSSFNEFNAIFCRHSTKSFNHVTRNRTHKLLNESLVLFGILGLSPAESVSETVIEKFFEEFDPEQNLYRKIA